MKRKNIAMVLGVVMCASLLAGCASTDNSKTSSKTSSDTVYGEVSKVEDEEITLKVGTRKKNSSEIKKTGEEKEITVTSDTEITREDMGEKPTGEKPSEDMSSWSDYKKTQPDHL